MSCASVGRIANQEEDLLLMMVWWSGFGLARSFDTGYEPEGLDELTKKEGSRSRPPWSTRMRIFPTTRRSTPRKVMLVVRDPGPAAEQMDNGIAHRHEERRRRPAPCEALAELKEIVNEAIADELGSAGELRGGELSGPGDAGAAARR